MRESIKTLLISILLIFISINISYAQNEPLLQSHLRFDTLGKPYIVINLTLSGTTKPNKVDNYKFLSQTDVKLKNPSLKVTGKQTTIFNGVKKVSTSMEIYFPIIAIEEGNKKIPSILLSILGKQFKTTPLNVTFFKVGKDIFSAKLIGSNNKEMVKFKLSAETLLAYPQQGIIVRADVFISPLKNYKPSSISFNFSFINDIGEQNFIPIAPQIKSKIIYKLPIENTDIVLSLIQLNTVEINGNHFYKFSGWFKVFATKPGELTLYSSKTEVTYEENAFSGVDDKFFSFSMFSDTKKFSGYSEVIKIKIKEFPEINKPNSFNGSVGRYSISTKVDETEIKVGEPILLEITISGDGIIENINPIDLTTITEFENDFKIPKESTARETSDNSITFKYTIRATNENVIKIPKIPFSYFDIDSESYNTIYSKEIPINVIASKILGEEDIISVNGESSNTHKQGITTVKGILSNYTGYDALSNQQINLIHYIWLLILPFGYIIAYIIIKKRKIFDEDIASKRSKNAIKKFEKYISNAQPNISNGSFYELLAKGLMNYISDKFNLGKGELTIQDIENIFTKYEITTENNRKLKSEFEKILKVCEMSRFASIDTANNQEKENLIETTKNLIRKIESIQKKKKR